MSREAASKLALTVQIFEVREPGELDGTFDAMLKANMQAIVINAESLFYKSKETLASLLMAHRLPTCAWVREMVEAGALMSYGTDQRAIARRVPVYVDKILKGAKPADLPVEQPTKFELVVNMKTAKELGVEVPRSFVAEADEVIE